MSSKNTNQPFVSVLTPVYNGEKFLEECIQSVLNQNYENWEYVIVDNQSTDNSSQIIEKYAGRDRRIRVHRNEEFLPQMENLNHAFRQISPQSKYCKVVHADDWLFPDCISEMVKVAEKHPSVGIVSSYRLDEKLVNLDGLPYPSMCTPGEEIAKKYLAIGTSYFGSPSSLLIRTDLIVKRDKVYEESLLATDTAACLDFLKESDFGFVHQVLTFTRRHDMSISNTEAKESYAFLHARLYALLTYGPHFLSETELEHSVARHLNKFYILLSRNLIENKSIAEFKRQREVLRQLDVRFEHGKFMKMVFRELPIQFLKLFDVQLKKAS